MSWDEGIRKRNELATKREHLLKDLQAIIVKRDIREGKVKNASSVKIDVYQL